MLTTLIAVVTIVATANEGLPVVAPATVGMSAKRLATIVCDLKIAEVPLRHVVMAHASSSPRRPSGRKPRNYTRL